MAGPRRVGPGTPNRAPLVQRQQPNRPRTRLVKALEEEILLIDGSIAVTEEADACSATGDVSGGTITGTVAVTEGNDTSSASGTITVSGTSATTEVNDTSSATGTVRVTGTVAVTEANDSNTATGTVTVTGTSATTETADAAAATGTVSGGEPPPPSTPSTGGGARRPQQGRLVEVAPIVLPKWKHTEGFIAATEDDDASAVVAEVFTNFDADLEQLLLAGVL